VVFVRRQDVMGPFVQLHKVAIRRLHKLIEESVLELLERVRILGNLIRMNPVQKLTVRRNFPFR